MKWTTSMMMDQIYSHVLQQGDALDGVRHINASAILRAIATGSPPFRIEGRIMHIDQNLHDLLVEHYGIEEPHIARIIQEPERLDEPVLVMEWPGGEHQTVIDGCHRLVARYRRGQQSARCFWIQFEDIHEYLVTDIPPMIEAMLLDFERQHDHS